MDQKPTPAEKLGTFNYLMGGGEMTEHIRTYNWANTPLGPIADWSQSLRTSVSICLTSHFPMLIWWGPKLVMIYNDAYIPILGDKHPKALGQAGQKSWPEIWNIIGPMLEGVLYQGNATWSENRRLILKRHSYPEECYFTFSYSPIRATTGEVQGVFTAVTETTRQVLSERRLQTLQELTKHTSEAQSLQDVAQNTSQTLKKNAADIPFSLFYILSSDKKKARLASSTQIPAGTPASPYTIEMDDTQSVWPFSQVLRTGQACVVTELMRHFDFKVVMPKKNDTPPPHTALVQLISQLEKNRSYGFLVTGISPYGSLTPEYQGFLSLIASQIATAYASTYIYQDTIEQAASMAKLDRAKTFFFSHISQEFRTPITLSLGPLEEILADTTHPLTAEQRKHLEMVHRNQLRQLKLVNNLLDFTRIEMERRDSHLVQTDVSQFTRELASMFHGAATQAGLTFQIETPSHPLVRLIDQDIWEKIVLNLLSNALKFTLHGHIHVSLKEAEDAIELEVEDTGIGISEEDLPHVFERFYQINHPQARTQEGIGIGLALTKELVHLLRGTITVQSALSKGTTFTVRLPDLNSNSLYESVSTLQKEKIESKSAPYVEEISSWFSDHPAIPVRNTQTNQNRKARFFIIVAESNADMRQYLSHLLSPQYEIKLVTNGKEAFSQSLVRVPDLIISDIMLPIMDGMELLSNIRNTTLTRAVPILLLSTQANEETTIKGLQMGANDYLVKPFSARELLARTQARLEISMLQQKSESARRYLHSLFMQAPAIIAVLRGPTHVFTLVNPLYTNFVGHSAEDLLNKPIHEALPELQNQSFIKILDQVYRTGQPFYGKEMHIMRETQGVVPVREHYINYVYQPVRELEGNFDDILIHAVDVTELVHARKSVEMLAHNLSQQQKWLEAILNQLPLPLLFIEPNTAKVTFTNNAANKLIGDAYPHNVATEDYRTVYRIYDKDGQLLTQDQMPTIRVARGEVLHNLEIACDTPHGRIPFLVEANILPGLYGHNSICVLTFQDITHLKELDQRKDEFFHTITHELRTPLTALKGNIQLAQRHLPKLEAELQKFSPQSSEKAQKSIDLLSELLERALRQADVQQRLMRDLVDVSRIQADKLDLTLEVCDLNQIILEAVMNQKASIPTRKFIFNNHHEPVFVLADADRIGQVIHNYLTNANKYSPANEPIMVGLKTEGQCARIWVRDQGPGLSPEQQEQIWQRFYQSSSTPLQSGTSHGFGLGLHISMILIHRQNGEVGVNSKPGHGSTFWFTLPLADAPTTQNTTKMQDDDLLS